MKNIQLVAPVLLLVACNSGVPLDVGDESRDLGQSIEDYAANWDGYAQATEFPGDGTDRVRMTIDVQGNGFIRFGEEELFVLGTDPDALYPPTYPEDTNRSLTGARSGFEYPFSGARVEAARIRMDAPASPSLMDGWCRLQGLNPLPGLSCALDGNGGGTVNWGQNECAYWEGESKPMTCTRWEQCRFCECNTEGCHAKVHPGGKRGIELDAALSEDGQSLTGTLRYWPDKRVTVVLERVSASL